MILASKCDAPQKMQVVLVKGSFQRSVFLEKQHFVRENEEQPLKKMQKFQQALHGKLKNLRTCYSFKQVQYFTKNVYAYAYVYVQ